MKCTLCRSLIISLDMPPAIVTFDDGVLVKSHYVCCICAKRLVENMEELKNEELADLESFDKYQSSTSISVDKILEMI